MLDSLQVSKVRTDTKKINTKKQTPTTNVSRRKLGMTLNTATILPSISLSARPLSSSCPLRSSPKFFVLLLPSSVACIEKTNQERNLDASI